jgi:hypothetical protein
MPRSIRPRIPPDNVESTRCGYPEAKHISAGDTNLSVAGEVCYDALQFLWLARPENGPKWEEMNDGSVSSFPR